MVAPSTGPTTRASSTPTPSSWGTPAVTASSCRPVRSSPLPPRLGWLWWPSWITPSRTPTNVCVCVCVFTSGNPWRDYSDGKCHLLKLIPPPSSSYSWALCKQTNKWVHWKNCSFNVSMILKPFKAAACWTHSHFSYFCSSAFHTCLLHYSLTPETAH